MVKQILLPHQIQRLEQLGFQLALKNECFQRRSVLVAYVLNKKLGLSSTKLEPLRELVESVDEKLKTTVEKLSNRIRVVTQTEDNDFEKVLTEKQVAKLLELRGAAFQGKLNDLSVLSVVGPITNSFNN